MKLKALQAFTSVQIGSYQVGDVFEIEPDDRNKAHVEELKEAGVISGTTLPVDAEETVQKRKAK
ncbi:MAG: hypothetical protein WKF61_04770 [Luteimonas sp.]